MTTPTSTTLIDRVDDNDEPIASVARGEALEVGANFRTAHVFVIDDRGALLLQRLAPTRDRHPGRWGSSVATYLFAGETYEAAARRRMADELCLDVPLQRLGKIAMDDEASRKFVTLFRGRSNAARVCEPAHISELRFWTITSVQSAMREDPELFTPTFRELFRFFLTRRRDATT